MRFKHVSLVASGDLVDVSPHQLEFVRDRSDFGRPLLRLTRKLRVDFIQKLIANVVS
jgi:hypothetical protein